MQFRMKFFELHRQTEKSILTECKPYNLGIDACFLLVNIPIKYEAYNYFVKA